MSERAKLLNRLAGLEALYSGATTPHEKDAARRGRERVRAHLAQLDADQPPRKPRGAGTGRATLDVSAGLWWEREPSTWSATEVDACAELIALLTMELEVLGPF